MYWAWLRQLVIFHLFPLGFFVVCFCLFFFTKACPGEGFSLSLLCCSCVAGLWVVKQTFRLRVFPPRAVAWDRLYEFYYHIFCRPCLRCGGVHFFFIPLKPCGTVFLSFPWFRNLLRFFIPPVMILGGWLSFLTTYVLFCLISATISLICLGSVCGVTSCLSSSSIFFMSCTLVLLNFWRAIFSICSSISSPVSV